MNSNSLRILRQRLLLVGLNYNITLRVSHARENPPASNLVIVEEAPVRLIHGPFHNFPGAGRARPRPARVRQINPKLLRLVQDVHVIRAVELLRPFRGNELHLVNSHGGYPPPAAAFYAEKSLPDAGEWPEACHRLPADKGGANHGAGESSCGCHFWLAKKVKREDWEELVYGREATSVDNGEDGGNIQRNEVASYHICHVATFCGWVYLFIITSDLLVTVVDTSLCFLMNQLYCLFSGRFVSGMNRSFSWFSLNSWWANFIVCFIKSSQFWHDL